MLFIKYWSRFLHGADIANIAVSNRTDGWVRELVRQDEGAALDRYAYII